MHLWMSQWNFTHENLHMEHKNKQKQVLLLCINWSVPNSKQFIQKSSTALHELVSAKLKAVHTKHFDLFLLKKSESEYLTYKWKQH